MLPHWHPTAFPQSTAHSGAAQRQSIAKEVLLDILGLRTSSVLAREVCYLKRCLIRASLDDVAVGIVLPQFPKLT